MAADRRGKRGATATRASGPLGACDQSVTLTADPFRRYHPDRLPSEATKVEKKLSETLFSRINSAFGTMTDPDKRKEYLAVIELEKAGGMEAIQQRVEAEFLIPQAQQLMRRRNFKLLCKSNLRHLFAEPERLKQSAQCKRPICGFF